MANEKRLIDANDVIRNLRKELDDMEPVDFWDDALTTYKKQIIPRLIFNVITYIKSQPTVDAVEVVHGRWIDGKCSNCNAVFTVEVYGEVFELRKIHSNYCPNCGAKMDGDKYE